MGKKHNMHVLVIEKKIICECLCNHVYDSIDNLIQPATVKKNLFS